MIIASTIVTFLLLLTVFSLEHFLHAHFYKTTIVVLISDIATIDDQLVFILKLNQPKLIMSLMNPLTVEAFDNYVIIDTGTTPITSSVNYIKYKVNPRGKFLIITLRYVPEDDLKSVFKTLWSFYIYNVVIYTNGMLVTWYPYQNNCGTSINIVVSNPKVNPFENKIPKNFQNCSFVITWDKIDIEVKNPHDESDPGYFVRLLNSLAHSMNTTPIYLIDNINYIASARDKGTYDDLKHEMVENKIDLAFAMAASTQNQHLGPELEISTSFLNIYSYFVLPPRRKITSSTSTLVIFSKTIWCLIVVSIFSMAFLWKILTQHSFQTCFFEVLHMFLQSTMTQRPRSTLQRVIFFLYFFYVVNLTSIYLSQLSGVLNSPSYEPKILTMKDIVASHHKLRFHAIYGLFFEEKSLHDALMRKRIPETKPVSIPVQLKDFSQKLNHGIILLHGGRHYIRNFQEVQVATYDKVTI